MALVLETSCSSSSMCKPSEEDVTAMDKLMSDGKRNYICNQPQIALDCFVELCEKLAKCYGQESDKCVEAYLYYGKTLFDIARLENGVLGHAVKEAPEEEEKDANVSSEKDDTVEKTNTEDSTTTSEDEEKTGGKVEVDDGIDCEGSDGDDDDSDDVSNMEISWEMFELTSVICKRQLSEEGHDYKAVKSTLAEAKYGLAQISLETERYEESVNDFNECLNLYKELLDDKNERVIAEVHYNIALALSFDKKFSEAIEQFECAVTILKARVVDLETKVKQSEEKGTKKEKAPAELEEWKKEIGELNDLIVLDMMTKIEDVHESKKSLDASIKTVKNAASELFSSLSDTKFDAGFDEGFDAPLPGDVQVVHDCSSKVRSIKRKSAEETLDISGKKVTQTNVSTEE